MLSLLHLGTCIKVFLLGLLDKIFLHHQIQTRRLLHRSIVDQVLLNQDQVQEVAGHGRKVLVHLPLLKKVN